MSQSGKSTLRLVICSAAIAYLVGDLLILKGPLHGAIREMYPDPNLVARVSGRPISRSQLDRAVHERLWLEGKSPAKLAPADLQTVRESVLGELIDYQLLALEISDLDKQPVVSDEEINDRVRLFEARFGKKEELKSSMKSQGIGSDQDLRNRLAAQIRQEKFIAASIGPAARITDEEARRWFDENPQSVALPERVEARHIFIPTLDHPPEEAKQKLDEALLALTEKKKDFATLAREISGDPATKDSGGALGWMSRSRLPADFAAPLFSMDVGKPGLIRTKLGWHLAEVTSRKPAEPRGFEQAKAEILSALEASKLRRALDDFRRSLRDPESSEIEIFADPPRSGAGG